MAKSSGGGGRGGGAASVRRGETAKEYVTRRFEETRPRANQLMDKAMRAQGYRPGVSFRTYLNYEDAKELDSYSRFNLNLEYYRQTKSN